MFKTLDLAAGNASDPCITGVACQTNVCRLRLGLCRHPFARFHLLSPMWHMQKLALLLVSSSEATGGEIHPENG